MPNLAAEDWSLQEYRKDSGRKADRPQKPPPLLIGKYLIEGSLGHGGAGIVYLARHPVSQQRVALKVMLQEQVTPKSIEDFLEEIRLLARFSHPGIATIFDADTFETGDGPRPYFTMQLIEGAKSVSEYVESARCNYRRRIELVLQAVSAVAAAHRLDVIHGDIKPRNALVGLDGDLRVVDFGASIDAKASKVAMLALSPVYAAPEQRRELRVIKQSDVYSLAVLAYVAITGQLPFAEDPVDGERGPAIPIRALCKDANRKIERVLLHALSDRPENRYADAGDFYRDLTAAIRGGLLEIDRPHTIVYRAMAFCAEHQGPVWAVLAVFLTLVAGMIGTGWQSLEARRQANEALRASGLADAMAKREKAAREAAQLSADREREARLNIERLRRSTENAIIFVPQLLGAMESDRSDGQPPSVAGILDAAEGRLAAIRGDERFGAIAHKTLGRIAASWGQFDRGARWLGRSVELWEQFANDASVSPEEKHDALQQQAEALNFLSWALLGDQRQASSLSKRAARAKEPARKAFMLSKQVVGATTQTTVCFQADWLRMQVLTGNPFDQLSAAMGFIELLATVAAQDTTAFPAIARDAIAETAQLALEGKQDQSMQRASVFLAPLLSPERPRLRYRMPWSLMQAVEELPSLPPLALAALGLTTDRIAALRPVMADLAVKLGKEIHPQDRVSLDRILSARERVLQPQSK